VALRPGDKLQFLPSHCCTTVNLHDRYYVIKDGRLVDIWPVAGRGRSQ
jgi:D-serine deaminase-like pyridoxal phosphate-dependent protein